MLNQFVIIGKLKERIVLSDSNECWILETDRMTPEGDSKKIDLSIIINFRKEEFDLIKSGDLIGIRGSFNSDYGNDLQLIADKITYLKSEVNE